MKKQVISIILLSVVVGGVGLVCGWYGAYKNYAKSEQGQDDAAQKSVMEVLSPLTLKNMGVDVTPAQLSSFSTYQPIPAVVKAAPFFR